jgi:hypothetical protein
MHMGVCADTVTSPPSRAGAEVCIMRWPHGECACVCACVCAGPPRLLRDSERKSPGFQRLRMAQYDELRKRLISSGGGGALGAEVRARGVGGACAGDCECVCVCLCGGVCVCGGGG